MGRGPAFFLWVLLGSGSSDGVSDGSFVIGDLERSIGVHIIGRRGALVHDGSPIGSDSCLLVAGPSGFALLLYLAVRFPFPERFLYL